MVWRLMWNILFVLLLLLLLLLMSIGKFIHCVCVWEFSSQNISLPLRFRYLFVCLLTLSPLPPSDRRLNA